MLAPYPTLVDLIILVMADEDKSMQFLLRNFRKYSVSTSFSTLQASVLRVATWRGLVVGYRHFRTWLSHLSSKILPIGYPDASVTSYHPTPWNLLELQRSGSLEFSGLRITTYLIAELVADSTVYPGGAGSHRWYRNCQVSVFLATVWDGKVAFVLDIDTVF